MDGPAFDERETHPDGWADLFAPVRRSDFFLPFAVLALLLLILPQARPFSAEEFKALILTKQGLAGTIDAVSNSGLPPLYFVILWPVRAIAGNAAWALRLLSIVFALASFPFVYGIARRFFGKSANIAVWLLATSSFVVFAGRFVREYSSALLLAAIATWLLFRLLEKPTRRLWIAYGVVTALSVYTYPLAIVTIAAHLVVFAVAWRSDPRRLIEPMIVYVATGVLYAPWVFASGSAGTSPPPADQLNLFTRLYAGTLQSLYLPYALLAGDSIPPVALIFSIPIVTIGTVLVALGMWQILKGQSSRRFVLLALPGFGVVMMFVIHTIGWSRDPFHFAPMRLLFAAPFFLMIVACGLLAIPGRRLRRIFFGVVMGIQVFALFNYYTGRRWAVGERVIPIAEMVERVESYAEPEHLIIFDTCNLSEGLTYLYDGEGIVKEYTGEPPFDVYAVERYRTVWIVRATYDRSPENGLQPIVGYLKLQFALIEGFSKEYVPEPERMFAAKQRWVPFLFGHPAHDHQAEVLVFEKPRLRADAGTKGPQGT